HPLVDHALVDARRGEIRGKRVAISMKSDLEPVPPTRQAPPRLAERLVEPDARLPRGERGETAGAAPHELPRRPLLTPGQEDGLQLRVQVDAAARLGPLARLLPAPGDHRVLVELDVTPAQPHHLPAAHPGVSGEAVQDERDVVPASLANRG